MIVVIRESGIKKFDANVDVFPNCVPSNTSLSLIHFIFHIIKGVTIPFSVTTFCITFKRFKLYASRNLIGIIRKSNPLQIDTSHWQNSEKYLSFPTQKWHV